MKQRRGRWMPRLDARGVAAIETALILPAFLLFMIGMMELGRAYWMRSSLQYAVDQAGRYTMINTTATTSAVQTYVLNNIKGFPTATVTALATDSIVSSVNYRTINASMPFDPFGNVLPGVSFTLTANTVVPLIP